MRDQGPTEIAGFGISDPEDLLLITDLKLLRQNCTWGSVSFEDEATAEFFDDAVEAGGRPEQFGRIWVHTHPGRCPLPSSTDETTFARAFGACSWAVMAIVANDGSTFARLQFAAGPGGASRMKVAVDYGSDFGAAQHDAWQAEYAACVRDVSPLFHADSLLAGPQRGLERREAEFNDADWRPFWDSRSTWEGSST